MSTKMKGLLKGLRYISQIFDEEKEQEMQIGHPTDVKHVAHIGFDGPALNDSPSWMKEYNSSSSTGFSAPLAHSGELNDNSDVKWVSEDSKRAQTPKGCQGKEHQDVPRSSRRQASTDNNSNESPKKRDPSSKSRQSRRKEGKETSEGGVKSGQESTSGLAPDIPRKARRKKSKELGTVNEGGSRRSRNRATTSNDQQHGPAEQTSTSHLTTVASLDDELRESRVTFKE